MLLKPRIRAPLIFIGSFSSALRDAAAELSLSPVRLLVSGKVTARDLMTKPASLSPQEPKEPNPFSTTSWHHEESQRTQRRSEQPDPRWSGNGPRRDRRGLPRLQRQQRPALRLDLQPQGAGT